MRIKGKRNKKLWNTVMHISVERNEEMGKRKRAKSVLAEWVKKAEREELEKKKMRKNKDKQTTRAS